MSRCLIRFRDHAGQHVRNRSTRLFGMIARLMLMLMLMEEEGRAERPFPETMPAPPRTVDGPIRVVLSGTPPSGVHFRFVLADDVVVPQARLPGHMAQSSLLYGELAGPDYSGTATCGCRSSRSLQLDVYCSTAGTRFPSDYELNFGCRLKGKKSGWLPVTIVFEKHAE